MEGFVDCIAVGLFLRQRVNNNNNNGVEGDPLGVVQETET